MFNISIREWINNYNNGLYNSIDKDTQIKSGWYDWFCKDEQLLKRLQRMAPYLIKISQSSKIDIDKDYVFFKNNCPLIGRLYDDFRICDIKTGEVIYTIILSCGHQKTLGRSQIWGIENNFKKPLVDGTKRDILNYFKD